MKRRRDLWRGRHPGIPARLAPREARVKGLDVAVFRTVDDKVFALLDRCPHKGGPLSQGIVHGECVACPLHNWTSACGNGCARAPDEGCTPQFAVQVREGRVFLDRRGSPAMPPT
jgi:nitrite reductase (NADH) small subunit